MPCRMTWSNASFIIVCPCLKQQNYVSVYNTSMKYDKVWLVTGKVNSLRVLCRFSNFIET